MPEADVLQADLDLVSRAARDAGQLALRYFRDKMKTWEKAPGDPVTEADIAVDKLLKERLLAARPDYGWLSEEAKSHDERPVTRRTFVVDPIDGTRAFMNGDPYFCIAIAVVQDGMPIVGVVHAPVFDELYAARKGGGATRNGIAISTSRCECLDGCRLIGEQRMIDHPDWQTPWPKMVLPRHKPNATAYRMVMVADGRWDAVAVLWRKGDWDVAAAALIVTEAGGQATDHAGEAFELNRRVPYQKSLVAAGPDVHRLLIERTKAVPLPDPQESL